MPTGTGWQEVAATTVAIMVTALGAQDSLVPIDLSGATAFADLALASPARRSPCIVPVPEILDGDETTRWSCGNHDLSVTPANLLIILPRATRVGRLDVIIPIHPEPEKYPMRITHMEVYAVAGKGQWAKLGEVRDNTSQPRFSIALTPARVDRIRLRVFRRSERVTGWAMLSDVQLYPAAEGVQLSALQPHTIPMTDGERHWIDRVVQYSHYLAQRLSPNREAAPTVRFDPEVGYLGYVRRFLDTMIEYGTDRYGPRHSPQWAGILDLETRTHPGEVELPVVTCISENQRRVDRILYGGNIQHDVMLLLAAEKVTQVTGDGRYRDAARAYLQFFLDHCTDTPTGLWPWGEHSGWDFYDEARDGRDIHHLLSQPVQFWELAWKLNSPAVIRECNGIINHVRDLDTFVFNRHADITEALPKPRPREVTGTGLDFANSAARFLRLWAFAYSRTGEPMYLDWSNRLVDHLQWSRIGGDGPLPVLSGRSARPLPDRPSWGNTMLVGISMLGAITLVGDTETAQRYERLGHEYLRMVAEKDMPENPKAQFTTGRGMGDFPNRGLHWAQAYRLTGDKRHLEAARRIGEAFRVLDRIPDHKPLRLQALGVPINLFVDMHELDGEPKWLAAAETYARWSIEHF